MGDPALIKLLIENKADINKMVNNATALMVAATLGKPSITRKLIKDGADVNQVDMAGKSALMKVVVNPSKVANKVMRILMDGKADVNLCNKHNENALNIAMKFGHKDRIAMLMNSGAKQIIV